jgi:hypothetical protein
MAGGRMRVSGYVSEVEEDEGGIWNAWKGRQRVECEDGEKKAGK